MPSPIWQFYLADAETLELLGELKGAKSRQLTIGLNRPGGFSCSMPLSDPRAELVESVTTAIVAKKYGVTRWSGPVWTRNRDTANGGTLALTAVGWFQLLQTVLMKEKWGVSVLTNGDFDDSTGWTGASALLSGAGAFMDLSVDFALPGYVLGQRLVIDSGGAPGMAYHFLRSSSGAVSGTLTHSQGATVVEGIQYRIRGLAFPMSGSGHISPESALDMTNTKVELLVNGVAVGTATFDALRMNTWNEVEGFYTASASGTVTLAFRTTISATNTSMSGGVFWEAVYLEPYKYAFANTDIGTIAQRLVEAAGQRVYPGLVQPSWNRTVAYQQQASIGAEIQRMSDVENGFDWRVDPETRQFNVYWPRYGSAYAQPRPSRAAHEAGNATRLYTFDGTLEEFMGSGATATTVGNVELGGSSLLSDGTGSSLALEGDFPDGITASYLSIPYVQLHDRSHAVSLVVHPDVSQNAYVFSSANGYAQVQVGFTNLGYVHLTVNSKEWKTPNGVITAGQPNHIVTTWSHLLGEAHIYVNGVDQTLTLTEYDFPDGDAGAALDWYGLSAIGGGWLFYEGSLPPRYPALPTPEVLDPFDGAIDEVGIWSGRSLSHAEVLELYRSLRQRSATGGSGPRFGYGGETSRNVASFSEVQDTSWLANTVIAQGTAADVPQSGYASDDRSIETYGPFDAVVGLGELDAIIAKDIIAGVANAEVALRSRPRLMLNFEPRPYVPGGNVPDPLIDYEPGDIVTLDVDHGAIQYRNQPVRIFGMTISVDDNGAERVSSLQTSAS